MITGSANVLFFLLSLALFLGYAIEHLRTGVRLPWKFGSHVLSRRSIMAGPAYDEETT